MLQTTNQSMYSKYLYSWLYDISSIYSNWLVVDQPSWNIWVRQWEGWHPIYEMENNKCLKPPIRYGISMGKHGENSFQWYSSMGNWEIFPIFLRDLPPKSGKTPRCFMVEILNHRSWKISAPIFWTAFASEIARYLCLVGFRMSHQNMELEWVEHTWFKRNIL